MPFDPQHIIEDLQQGKESAMKQLYDCFYPSLCAYGFGYIADEEAVVDIVQEVFITLWTKRKDFFSFYSLRSFLYTSVRNACLNEIRQQNRYPKEALIESLTHEEEYTLIEEEVHRMIHQEIANLPDAMRKVFELTLLDMSIAQIAEALNISENTVRNQRAAARKKLQEKLNKWFYLLFL